MLRPNEHKVHASSGLKAGWVESMLGTSQEREQMHQS